MRLINKLDGLDKGVSFRMRRTKTAFELPEGQWTSNNLPNWWKCKIGVIVWTLIANWVNFSFLLENSNMEKKSAKNETHECVIFQELRWRPPTAAKSQKEAEHRTRTSTCMCSILLTGKYCKWKWLNCILTICHKNGQIPELQKN